jgi:hypothetical protein
MSEMIIARGAGASNFLAVCDEVNVINFVRREGRANCTTESVALLLAKALAGD